MSSLASPLTRSCIEGETSINLSNEKKGSYRGLMIVELKKQVSLAGPLICVSVLQYLVQVISIMFVGHLDELSLAGASMATSFGSVTGLSLLMGLASALDTFCGQSFGAKEYRMMGIHLQRAMLVLLLVSIPLACIWAYTGPILKALGQDENISREAGEYAQFMIPGLFALALTQCLNRFLQMQNIVYPIMMASAITTLLHVLGCWILVFRTDLRNRGAALANSISYWINALLLGLYVKYSPSCSKTWTGFSKEAFHNISGYVRLAIPSAVMVCLEMWSFELLVLLSGLLPNPTLQTSVLSICLNTAALIWMIPFGLSCAISTRVSNELGAGYPEAARIAVYIVLFMAISVGLLVGIILLLIRNVWGYVYSSEIEVVEYVSRILPILALANVLDGVQCVLSGNARGCGWQKIGAFVNLGAYYLVGLPASVLLGFIFHLGGPGLYWGIICALIVQVVSLLTITIRTNWDEQAKKATERVYNHIHTDMLQ